jgi:predicted N-acetyltransferase YhbS
LFKESQQCYQLARMAVEPSERGKGYGNVLIRAALERVRESGAARVYLHSNTVLASAIALYRKHGFNTYTEGRHPVYARSNIVMELLLHSDAQENHPVSAF